MENHFLTGILIGFIFGMPVGAIGALTVQRTFRYGMREGLLTGLGSSAADCVYAVLGAFGMTVFSEALLSYQRSIHLVGGTLTVLMGIHLIRSKQRDLNDTQDKAKGFALFLSSFLIGITNPGAILTFLFAFSYFGLPDQMELLSGIQLVMGVFVGTYLWWGALSFAVAKQKKKTKIHNFKKWNRIFGVILLFFGVVVFIGG